MAEKIDWTPTLKEVIWWRDDITVEEYEEERAYFYTHYDDFLDGTYMTLYEQQQGKILREAITRTEPIGGTIGR